MYTNMLNKPTADFMVALKSVVNSDTKRIETEKYATNMSDYYKTFKPKSTSDIDLHRDSSAIAFDKLHLLDNSLDENKTDCLKYCRVLSHGGKECYIQLDPKSGRYFVSPKYSVTSSVHKCMDGYDVKCEEVAVKFFQYADKFLAGMEKARVDSNLPDYEGLPIYLNFGVRQGYFVSPIAGDCVVATYLDGYLQSAKSPVYQGE